MGMFHTIIQSLVLPVLDAYQDLALRYSSRLCR